MSAGRVALGGWILVAGLYVATLALTAGQPWAEPNAALWHTAAFAFASIGGLIAVRRPGNRIGALFLASGGLLVLSAFGYAYASRSLLGGSDLPGTSVALWLWMWTNVPAMVALLVFLPLLFPDGRLLSRRWRPVAWLGVGLIVVASVALAVDPEPATDLPFENPFAVPALAPFSAFMRDTGFVFVPLLTLAAAGSLVLRMRRSAGGERQQMKWFGYPFLLAALYILVVWGVLDTVLDVAVHPLIQLAGIGVLLAIPGSVAVAVLRYRLYEIDRVISRTVAYAILTVLLVGIYVGGVLALGALVRAVTGSSGGDLVVAASTLAVAAAFGPLRRRVQAMVDRRFNRARYDAQRTVEAFAQRLRDEVDLDALATETARVAAGTMHPSSLSLWLRGSESSS